jgi:nucleotide-binding universal stress UspA family protein
LSGIRSIVAATDLSASARRAAHRAARLAQASSASLMLVHVVSGSAVDELRRWLDVGGDPGQSIVDEVRARLKDLASELAGTYGVHVETKLVTGRPVDEVARIADEAGADLIVAGTLGAGYLRSRLVGSTVERIVRKSTRPALMVRQSPRSAYARVLVAVDFSRWSVPSLQLAASVAPDADFVLVHCVEPLERMPGLAGLDTGAVEHYRTAAREDALQRLHDLAGRAGLAAGRWSAVVRAGMAPWLHIVRLEQEHDCDLIVIGKHGANAFEELLLGSTTNTVIAESAADVLVGTRPET